MTLSSEGQARASFSAMSRMRERTASWTPERTFFPFSRFTFVPTDGFIPRKTLHKTSKERIVTISRN